MTQILCYEDSYLRQFQATITHTTPKGIVLDRTAFYPGGGGQPSDSGTLTAGDTQYTITKLSRQNGELTHEIQDTSQDLPPVGTPIHGELHWQRRYLLMRTHTALHILCGVVWRDYGAQVTGGNMQPGSARMDFELEHMSADFAQRMEELVNKEVQASRPIQINTLPRDEAFQIPDLIRTKINLLPPAIKEIRTVNITGLDLQADGGTHVANTSEVGAITIVGHESKGRINKRLRIRIDP